MLILFGTIEHLFFLHLTLHINLFLLLPILRSQMFINLVFSHRVARYWLSKLLVYQFILVIIDTATRTSPSLSWSFINQDISSYHLIPCQISFPFPASCFCFSQGMSSLHRQEIFKQTSLKLAITFVSLALVLFLKHLLTYVAFPYITFSVVDQHLI
jgi:hypothetical protein